MAVPDGCPEIPEAVIERYRQHVQTEGIEDDDDDRFDDAFDFVLAEDDVPWEDDDDEAVECMREWAYELLRLIGRPYIHETVDNPVAAAKKRMLRYG